MQQIGSVASMRLSEHIQMLQQWAQHAALNYANREQEVSRLHFRHCWQSRFSRSWSKLGTSSTPVHLWRTWLLNHEVLSFGTTDWIKGRSFLLWLATTTPLVSSPPRCRSCLKARKRNQLFYFSIASRRSRREFAMTLSSEATWFTVWRDLTQAPSAGVSSVSVPKLAASWASAHCKLTPTLISVPFLVFFFLPQLWLPDEHSCRHPVTNCLFESRACGEVYHPKCYERVCLGTLAWQDGRGQERGLPDWYAKFAHQDDWYVTLPYQEQRGLSEWYARHQQRDALRARTWKSN